MKSHRRYAKLVHPGGVAARVEYSDECVVSPQRNVRVFGRGLHSSTSQLNLSRFRNKNSPRTSPNTP